jgi:phosphoenolpyruvate carboxykinase (GTP)
VPSIAAEWEDPAGVPISAFLFGGRRATSVPLVTEAFDWNHGVYLAANLASEGTAAAENKIGALRRDPFAMLPFCGYAMGDYFKHWVDMAGKVANGGANLPKIYLVNWFRKSGGKFLWPGYGDNIRVVKWVIERAQGKADAVESVIGLHPVEGGIDLSGLSITPEQYTELMTVSTDNWREEAEGNGRDLAALGALPAAILEQQAALEARLAKA